MKEYKNKKLFQICFICIRLHRKSNKDNFEGKLFNPIPAKPRLRWQSQYGLNLMSGTHKVSDHHLHQEQQQQPKIPQTSQQLTEFSFQKNPLFQCSYPMSCILMEACQNQLCIQKSQQMVTGSKPTCKHKNCWDFDSHPSSTNDL
jgi:hypothetical protein